MFFEKTMERNSVKSFVPPKEYRLLVLSRVVCKFFNFLLFFEVVYAGV